MRPSSKRTVKELQPESETQGKHPHNGISQTKTKTNPLCFPSCLPQMMHELNLQAEPTRGRGLRTDFSELIRPSQRTCVCGKQDQRRSACTPRLTGEGVPAPHISLPASHLIPVGPQFLQKAWVMCDKIKWFYQEGSLV